MTTITPSTIDEIQQCVREHEKIHIVGRGTKTALLTPSPDVTVLSTAELRGIVEYLPDEYTITVKAGTPVHEMQSALAEHQQYLPFDPMMAQTASIGGTVATNLSGARRLRYGGVRDFILGATIVDGAGRSYRTGGKVVKNAAGFDLPKFFVGSVGKYAVLTDITFKVFPEPPAFSTLRLTYATIDDLLAALFMLNQSVFEMDALDFVPGESGWTVYIRLAGSDETLSMRSERLLAALNEKYPPQAVEHINDDAALWAGFNNFTWQGSGNDAC